MIKAMKQIAIIDDDVYIGDMLSELLGREGALPARRSSRCPVEERRLPSAFTDMISRSERVKTSVKGLSSLFTSSRSSRALGTT